MRMKKGLKSIIMILAVAVLAAMVISSCGRRGETAGRDDDDDGGASVKTTENSGKNGNSDTGDDTQDGKDDKDKKDPSDNGEPRNTDKPADDDPGGDGPGTLVPGIPKPGDDDPGDDDPGNDDQGLNGGGDIIEVEIGRNVFRLDTLLTYDDVKYLGADELAALRNSYYAAKGLIFKNEKFTEMFSQYDWYKPQHDNVEGLLTDGDKLNINLVLKVEGKYSALYDVFSLEETPFIGFWQHGMPYVGSGYARTYTFGKDRKVVFGENEMDGEERVRALYGYWYVLNQKLFVYYTSRDVIVGGELEPATGSVATDYEIVGGTLVTEELKEPIFEMYDLSFDQDSLEFGDEWFGVLIGGEEYYYMGEERPLVLTRSLTGNP